MSDTLHQMASLNKPMNRCKFAVNMASTPVLERAKGLQAAMLFGSVAHCAQSVKLLNNGAL